ncbi:unnamed protein product [Peniophora sp. CBMAI 1063]|nr:unnamed protein product [Peniophora sp. CBMAI 1063]
MTDDGSQTLLTSSITSRFSEYVLASAPRGVRVRSMDHELDAVEQALCKARRMRNMQTYACALPRELLVYIFEYLQAIWLPRREPDRPDPAEADCVFCSGWITVTHVCSFWREVALNVPSLWSGQAIDILDIPHQYIPEILMRSRLSTLDIVLCCDHESTQARADPSLNAWFSPAILRHARSLYICADEDLANHLWSRLPLNMELLQRLDVSAFEDEDVLELPAPLRNLPSVTSLTLWDYAVPWRSAVMSSKLTKLDIGYEFLAPPSSYEDLRDLLSLLQSLEVLELRGINPHFGTALNQLPNIVLSPLLKRMRIHTTIDSDSGISLNNLMLSSVLKTPPQCDRYLGMYGLEHDMALIEEILARLLPLLSLIDYEDMELQHLQLTQYTVRLVSSSIPPECSTSPHRPPYECTAHFTFGDLMCPNPLELYRYLHLFAAGHLHTLSFDEIVTSALSSENLWPGLLRAKKVRSVGLLQSADAYDYSSFFDALCTEHLSGDSIDSAGILFPQMDQLALPLSGDETASSDVIVGLIDLVYARQQKGAPLRELLIPKGVGHWIAWGTLRTMVKVTVVEYPTHHSPVIPNYIGL